MAAVAPRVVLVDPRAVVVGEAGPLKTTARGPPHYLQLVGQAEAAHPRGRSTGASIMDSHTGQSPTTLTAVVMMAMLAMLAVSTTTTRMESGLSRRSTESSSTAALEREASFPLTCTHYLKSLRSILTWTTCPSGSDSIPVTISASMNSPGSSRTPPTEDWTET